MLHNGSSKWHWEHATNVHAIDRVNMQIGYWEPVVHLIIGRGTFALLVYAPRYDNPSKVMHLEQSDGKH